MLQQIAKALVRILRNSREAQYLVLTTIKTIAEERPELFRPFLSDFFVKSTDPTFNRLMKLDIIAALSCRDNSTQILRELQTYAREQRPQFVCSVVRAIAKMADADTSHARNCLCGVMHLLLCVKHVDVVAECVVALRQILQQRNNVDSQIADQVLRQLAKLLISDTDGDTAHTCTTTIEHPVARASVIWLISENYEALQDVSADLLRVLATRFVDEEADARAQIANFAVKLALRLPQHERVQLLATHVLELARYDLDTDLRDRARFLTAMMVSNCFLLDVVDAVV